MSPTRHKVIADLDQLCPRYPRAGFSRLPAPSPRLDRVYPANYL